MIFDFPKSVNIEKMMPRRHRILIENTNDEFIQPVNVEQFSLINAKDRIPPVLKFEYLF
jgi:hypothetical protein